LKNTYLFFDTETTGLPKDYKAPVADLDNWPRLVQLAYLLFDTGGNELSSGDFIIKPEGFSIPAEVSKVHGITDAQALRHGYSLMFVLGIFESMINECEILVAHNMSFDEKIVGAEFLRAGMNNPIPPKKKICTMKSTIDFCAITGKYGYKYPGLSELYQKLFNTGFEEAHNAFADIRATARCFWELKRLGKI